tara:strand:- start:82337 stop:83578 length:1242 start_codon:yes stop_codon:yes gene_type:complete
MQKKVHYHSDCPFFAGCESMLVNFWMSEFIRQRFEVSFSYRASALYEQGLNARSHINFPVYPLVFPELSKPTLLPQKLPLFLKRVIFFFIRLVSTLPLLGYQIWRLWRLFRRLKPDLIHINNGGYPAALSARAAVIAAKFAGIDHVVMVVNNMAIDYRRFSRWWEYPIDRFVARTATKFVTGSIAAGNQLQHVLRLPANKVQAIHNGIMRRDTTESLIETRKRLGLEAFDGVIFGVVAVMDPRKGHQVLLDAVRYILQQRDTKSLFKILIEGDGPLRSTLEDFVIANQLVEHCIFVGTETHVMNLMAVLDVVILPSVSHEDFPNIVLEAMAFSKPVIASQIAGTSEQIIDGETGLLVEPRNIKQLATAFETLLLDKKLRARMGELAQQRFQKHFIADVSVSKYVSLYQSIITE